MANKTFNQNSNFYVNNGKLVAGYSNSATGTTATFIGGGRDNIISKGGVVSPIYSVIGGGKDNEINHTTTLFNSPYTTIVGGYRNQITSQYNFKADLVLTKGPFSAGLGGGFIGGGVANRLSDDSEYSFIGVEHKVIYSLVVVLVTQSQQVITHQ
jgi:hypothetical protein